MTAIADAARRLEGTRRAWLTPLGASEVELKRTLTGLYNAQPTWLQTLHRKLDAAVAAAYGWPDTLPDAEILERLLALNGERTPPSGASALSLPTTGREASHSE